MQRHTIHWIGVVCALAGLMTLCVSALPIASNTWKSLYARRRKRSWFISSAIRNNMGFEGLTIALRCCNGN